MRNEVENTYHKGMGANSLSAAQYNNLIKRLDITMEHWLVTITHANIISQ